MLKFMARVGLILFALMAVTVFNVSAAQIKIGIVDINTVITESDAGKAVNDSLARYVENVRIELNAKQQVINDLRQGLEELSEAEQNERLQEIEKLESELQEELAKAQQDIDQLTEEYRKLVLEDIGKVLALIAQEDGYHLILDSSVAYYYSNLVEITWEVIRKYNDLYEQALQAAQSQAQ
jgi:outer membrane protein